jgi:hypothetical protein
MDKRGYSVAGVIFGLLVAFVAIVLLIAIYGTTNGSGDFSSSLQNSFETVTNGFLTFLGPLFNVLLGLDGLEENIQFLVILTFVLISIIVVATLDSSGLFGGDEKSKIVNFAVGIIVAIIGVRFMPQDMWASLTAPSTAFVATILAAIPFFAFFVLTMSIRAMWVRKLLWLFYMLFMSYLIFFPLTRTAGTTTFAWIYGIFLFLGAIMLFFDSGVRRFWNIEKGKLDIEKNIGKMKLTQRRNLRVKIEQYQDIVGDPGASATDIASAKKELAKLRALYGDLSSL